ncbi:hypothetical protein DFJ74DRAFT_19325 [Hyaloraphidium curvatum]|nr:hypothetical protein DFJ74DRAFT_19325 [Hyaloraphidium curvatum]
MDDGSRKRALDIDGPSQTWLKTKKLKESGLVYKEGKFSAEEKQKLRDAVLYYRDAHGLSDEDIQLLIYKRRNATTKEQKDRMAEHKGFWKEIASTLPDRTVESQYRAVQREFDVQNKKGKWTEDEDTVLRTLVVTMSKNWVEIAAQIGRTASGCADRWKVLERLDQEKNSGKWTPDEELLYKNAFESLVAQGRVPDVKDKEFWEEIAVHVGTRTYVQCRQKWNRQTGVIPADMQPAEAPVLEKVARWNYASDDILLVKLDELVAQGVQHESEIEWRTLRDDALPWAQGKIHDAFNRLRSKVEDSTSKTFPDCRRHPRVHPDPDREARKANTCPAAQEEPPVDFARERRGGRLGPAGGTGAAGAHRRGGLLRRGGRGTRVPGCPRRPHRGSGARFRTNRGHAAAWIGQ